MSVRSEINRIAANVSEAFEAIRETGASVSAGAKSDDLATNISKIPDAVLSPVNTLLDEINGKVI